MSQQQSMTTNKKIWLSISILIAGYLLSMIFGFFLAKQTESRLNDVSESWFPAATLSIEALNEFKQEVTSFSDAVLMGEDMHFDTAQEQADKTIALLQEISRLEAISPHRQKSVERAVMDLTSYTTEAMDVYEKATAMVLEETFTDSIAEDINFAMKMKDLADQAEDLTTRLNTFTEDFRIGLRDDLLAVIQSTRRQGLINFVVFIGVVLISLALIRAILSRATLEVLERDRAEADLRKLNEELEQRVKDRTADLANANEEIKVLNDQLKEENLRMGAELEITKQLQQMVLPRKEELLDFEGLDIAGFMEPADEVGGDYYDVLRHPNGDVKISIGDVTGHGLESGVVMLMAQTAIRTLLNSGFVANDPKQFMNIINQTIYKNVERMRANKSLTLALVSYQAGEVRLSGQHEKILIVRKGGQVEQIDTMDLGFPIGLDENIADFISEAKVDLQSGDGAVLYTDGFTEAENEHNEMYGIDRLCDIISRHWPKSADEIKQEVINDVRRFIGQQKVYDDLTLVVVKQL